METMARERECLPFDLERMTYALGGGEYNVQLKRRFMNVSLPFPVELTVVVFEARIFERARAFGYC